MSHVAGTTQRHAVCRPLSYEGIRLGEHDLLLFRRQPARGRKDPQSGIRGQLIERDSWHDGDILIFAVSISTAGRTSTFG
jgi:hypothetical protein